VLNNLNGINHQNIAFYNTEGYAIDHVDFPFGLTDIKLSEIKEDFEIDTDYSLTACGDSCIHFINVSNQEHVTNTVVHYIFQTTPNTTSLVSFRTMLDRRTDFESKVCLRLLNDGIPQAYFSNYEIDSIRFAGRFIQLGPDCNWSNVNNVRCPRRGQMSWSEFQNVAPAVETLQKQMTLTMADHKVSNVQMIPVRLEGSDAQALRVTLKIMLPKALLGGSNELIVYYVVAPVRERFVSCVLSHYNDEAKPGELPALLSEVLVLL
jgi:hypothetical protein